MWMNWFMAWRRWSIIERLPALVVLIFVALAPVLCIESLSPANSLASTPSLESSSTPSSSSEEAQDIVAKSVSAMAHVNSYRLDTDVLNTYKVLDGPNQITTLFEWNGTKLIDVFRREMKMDMTIDVVNYYGSNDTHSIEMYFTGGYEYCKSTSLHVYGGPENPWDKNRLTNEDWTAESQMSYYIKLLETGSQANVLGSESISGIDCYVLTLSPSTEAMVDWVISQGQPAGPSLGVMAGGAISVHRADAYQGGSVKLWVEKDSYLPLKAEVSAVFDGFVGGGAHPVSSEPYIPTTGHVNSSFDAQATFSGYNQPVSIQLPQEALNAQEVSDVQEHTPLWVWIAIGVSTVVILALGILMIRHRMTRARV
jgi:hypothetical protein